MEDCVRDALLAQQIAGTTVPVYKGNYFITKAQLKAFY